ncbi:MAG: hypothetical protein ACT4QB_14140 [Gammaproteobacteria bacterium]
MVIIKMFMRRRLGFYDYVAGACRYRYPAIARPLIPGAVGGLLALIPRTVTNRVLATPFTLALSWWEKGSQAAIVVGMSLCPAILMIRRRITKRAPRPSVP